MGTPRLLPALGASRSRRRERWWRCSRGVAAVATLVIVGCSVRIEDRTATPFGDVTDGTPGVGNDGRTRNFQINIARELFVSSASIAAFITVNGDTLPMNGSGTGLWTYTTNDRDPQRPGHLRPGYEVTYEVRYRALGRARSERRPDSGPPIFIGYGPAVFVERDDPLFFTSNSRIKEVGVHNLSRATVEITSYGFRPIPVGIGDSDPAAFELLGPPPAAPISLAPGDRQVFQIRFSGGRVLNQVELAIATSHAAHPELVLPVGGRIFF